MLKSVELILESGHMPQKCIRLFIALIVLGSLVAVPAWPARADESPDLRLVPYPKQVEVKPGTCNLARPLILQVPAAAEAVIVPRITAELRRAGVADVTVTQHQSASHVVALASEAATPDPVSFPDDAPGESYCLTVTPTRIQCSGIDPAGLLYGVQTLCQLIRANCHQHQLPCLAIRDWPSLRWRCFQDDLTRGPSSTLDTLRQHVDLGAELKMNLFTYYMEYQYAFQKHPVIGPPDGSLQPEELRALVEYAAPRQIDILGNQQSFGHWGRILRHPEFEPLRETADVLCPTNEATYQLLDYMYSEVCPLLLFSMFNVCCDETWGLGTGPSKTLADEIGVGGVYVRHLRRVHDLLKEKYNKRMMMWGDIILQHPDKLDQIPKDTVMLTWGYHAADSFEDQILPFTEAGYDFFVCPGINNWSRILPDFGVTVQNIRNFVRDGAQHGALGMLNTEWEDDGEALQGYKWHGYAWGAECAWNASTTDIADFNRRIGGVLFGEPGDHFGQAIELLAETHRLPGMKAMMNARFWEEDLPPQQGPARSRAAAERLLGIVRPAIEHLEACQKDAVVNAHLLDAFLLGARRMELIGQRMLDGLRAAEAYTEAYQTAEPARRAALLAETAELIDGTRQAHIDLGREFQRIWLSECKPYALDWTMKRYADNDARYAALAARVAAARAMAENNEPLPEPAAIGLAVPAPPARNTRPQQVEATALRPDDPWLEPAATHRIGVVIAAGSADRFQLPVELDITLPQPLVSQPVRAFQLDTGGEPREILAQLDQIASTGGTRLVLLVPGILPKDQPACVHVYLGLSAPPEPLPEAVHVDADEPGFVRLHNNAVQLLLGAEGAHVYGWQALAGDGRDLTMPGTDNWSGFSDLGGELRRAVNGVTCLADGPALARFLFTDGTHMEKTISLFGGCSWIEVMLSDPVGYYWDFDNPQNFAADGPTPGTYLFADGATGAVGREADGVPAQVKADGVRWGIKWNQDRLALGLITPEVATRFVIAPGAGAGGVGVEGTPLASHFITFAGPLDAEPAVVMQRLTDTLDLRQRAAVILYAIEARR